MFKKILKHNILFFLFLLHSLSNMNAQVSSKTECDNLILSGVEALNKNHHSKSLELLNEVRALAKKNDWNKQEFLALNNIGANYYKLLEYGEALNYYLEAYTIAIKKLTPKDEMIVLNNIAILYSEEKKYQQAKDYFKRAYTIAKENKDSLKTGLYALNLGSLAIDTNNPKLGKTYFIEALPLLVSQPQFLVFAKIGLANCNLLQGNTKLSRESAQNLLTNTENLEFNNIGIDLLTHYFKIILKRK